MRFTKKQVDEVARKSRRRFIITRRLSFLVGLVLGVSSTLGGNYVYQNWDECRDYLNERIESFTTRRSNIVVNRTPVFIMPVETKE